ncbi:conserved hypothetical protein [Vibrio coralliirubri]|uniref:hypothetical protein n=1 Tax=Vibrio coralliirubri TaxID=1516159 RepID=UPI000637E61D|nr:hypothetical protein [Vibrio coralliirubri]CDU04690.1 conserved hypothetical protein [Vibrio coralliirubri]
MSSEANLSVAQSGAIAVSDAVDALRNVNSIRTTTIGVALSLMLESDDERYTKVIQEATKIGALEIDNFGETASKARELIGE